MIALQNNAAGSTRRRRAVGFIAAVTLCLGLVWHFAHSGGSLKQVQSWTAGKHSSELKRPPNQRIVGLLFYGRPVYVEMLDCYVRKNLVSNGGWLDEVMFVADTTDRKDLAFLDQLVGQVPEYTQVRVHKDKGNFLGQWRAANESDTIYVKIDDDLVWLADDAVPRVVSGLISHPEALAMAGNIINSPVSRWFHYRTGAVRPFLPETLATKDLAESEPKGQWRTSYPHLPYHDAHPGKKYDDYSTEIAFPGARMLPLAPGHDSLKWTPLYGSSQYGTGWDKWGNWQAAQQTHYSFFWNVEHKTLDRYWFGSATDGTWDLHNDHYNTNFFAMWGRDVNADLIEKLNKGDEHGMTEYIPEIVDKPFMIDSHALIVHYSYGRQLDKLRHTDVLDRYRALAKETACPANTLKGEKFRWEDYGIHD
ncbi:hypothetical protein DOTSEDRAFT_75482 [Dothistroma septosporum NZE10]|uniref:Uncharacterized protein n=1 Tax=Dothistroma septosporum (strain NZE10 / CBS 128990) TaxID=675120 RepID=M2YIL1_DOTSN|nr:hypothetical protein DOTSEDRAFT_75482 [Dothistroma septosporum NZE10]